MTMASGGNPHGGADGADHAQPDGSHKQPAVVRPAEGEELFQRLEALRHLPVVFDADVGSPHGLIKRAGSKQLRPACRSLRFLP